MLFRSGLIVDLRPALRAARNAGDEPYQRTDTHWTSVGAYIAYCELLAALDRRRGTRTEPIPRGAFASRTLRERGDMIHLSNALLPLETVTWLDPLRAFPAVARNAQGDAVTLLAPGRQPKDGFFAARVYPTPIAGRMTASQEVIATQDDPSLPTAVVFHDSFMPALAPYLAQHFRRIRFVWGHHIDIAHPVLMQERPDVVIDQHVQRNVHFMAAGDWPADAR